MVSLTDQDTLGMKYLLSRPLACRRDWMLLRLCKQATTVGLLPFLLGLLTPCGQRRLAILSEHHPTYLCFLVFDLLLVQEQSIQSKSTHFLLIQLPYLDVSERILLLVFRGKTLLCVRRGIHESGIQFSRYAQKEAPSSLQDQKGVERLLLYHFCTL